CRPVQSERLAACREELCQWLGLRCRPLLLASAEVRCPLLLGVCRPAVVLPDFLAKGGDIAGLRLILAHELAHCRRRDLLWAWLPAVAEFLFFFHPLVWLARREIRLAQEVACDALAVGSTSASPAVY